MRDQWEPLDKVLLGQALRPQLEGEKGDWGQGQGDEGNGGCGSQGG